MAINYTTPSGTGTLSPPILNDITQVNAPLLESIEISSENDITLSPQGMMTIAGTQISIISSGNFDLLGNGTGGTLNINGFGSLLVYDTSLDVDFDVEQFLIQTGLYSVNCPLISLNGQVNTGLIKVGSSTTANILAITPEEGMQVYNSDEQQMFFYQVSPITGTVLGWYNSTGTILL